MHCHSGKRTWKCVRHHGHLVPAPMCYVLPKDDVRYYKRNKSCYNDNEEMKHFSLQRIWIFYKIIQIGLNKHIRNMWHHINFRDLCRYKCYVAWIVEKKNMRKIINIVGNILQILFVLLVMKLSHHWAQIRFCRSVFIEIVYLECMLFCYNPKCQKNVQPYPTSHHQHIGTETKWLTVPRRPFQMHLFERRLKNFK